MSTHTLRAGCMIAAAEQNLLKQHRRRPGFKKELELSIRSSFLLVP